WWNCQRIESPIHSVSVPGTDIYRGGVEIFPFDGSQDSDDGGRDGRHEPEGIVGFGHVSGRHVAGAEIASITLTACYQRRHHHGEDIRNPRQEWRCRMGSGNAWPGR